MTKNELIEEAGKAVEILYNLKIKLSNGFVPATTEKSKLYNLSLHGLNDQIFRALNELDTNSLLQAGKDCLQDNDNIKVD